MLTPMRELLAKHKGNARAALAQREAEKQLWSYRREFHQRSHIPFWIAQGSQALLREATAQPWLTAHYPYRTDFHYMEYVH